MKRLLFALLLVCWLVISALPALAARQTVANGETMGQARTKINANDTELYAQAATKWASGIAYTADNTMVMHGGNLFVCTSNHTAAAATEPGVGGDWATVWAYSGAALWEPVRTAASQAEMEAGTETAIRSMSPLRIAQAIAALAGSTTDQPVYQANCATIESGFCVDTDDGSLWYHDGSTVTEVGTGTGDDLGDADAAAVAALFSGTGDYLGSDGTQKTPTDNDSFAGNTVVITVGDPGSDTNVPSEQAVREAIDASGGGTMVYPGAGVPNSTGSAWGTSYGVVTEVGGTGADTNIPTEQAVREALSALSIPTASSLSVDDLITLSGVAEGATSLGTFTGSTIPDNQTNKQVLQVLETAIEGAVGGHDAVTLATGIDGLSLSGQELSLATLLENIADLTPTANRLLGINATADGIEQIESISIDVDLGVQSSTTAGRLGRTSGDQITMGDNAGAATLMFSPTDDTAGNGATTANWSADKTYDELALKVTLVASGTASLGTSEIASGACATAVTATATGTATTDVIGWGFNGDPTSTTGYAGSANGMLTIIAYPTANNVNFRVCNNTSAAITPGAITLNWRVVR